MKKNLILIIGVFSYTSSNEKQRDDGYLNLFPHQNQYPIESVQLSPNTDNQIIIINKDSTLTTIKNSNTFSSGTIVPKGDSIFFHPKNISKQNLFLSYNLIEQNTDELTIQAFD